MNITDRSRRRNQFMLALNILLFVTCGIVMIVGRRPLYSWIILLVLVANMATLTSILMSR